MNGVNPISVIHQLPAAAANEDSISSINSSDNSESDLEEVAQIEQQFTPIANESGNPIYLFEKEGYLTQCCLTYGSLNKQTECELEAASNQDYKKCFKLGLLNRILRTVQCCIYTPILDCEAILACTAAVGCLCSACFRSIEPTNVISKPEEINDISHINTANTKGCALIQLACLLCNESGLYLWCCPINLCCPELGYQIKLQNKYIAFEQKKLSAAKRAGLDMSIYD